MSGTARVITNETDKSQRVSAQSEAFIAGVIPSERGLKKPVFTTNQNDFYKRYTPNAQYEAGFDLTYIEMEKYLETNSNLYINRVVKNATLAACTFFKTASSKDNAPVTIEFKDQEDFVMSTNNGRPLPGDSTFTVDATADTLEVDDLFYSLSQTGDVVRFIKGAVSDVFPIEIIEATDYYLIKDATENIVRIASSKVNALAGTYITLSTGATLTDSTIINNEVTLQTELDQPAVLFYAADPGKWANKISLKLVNYTTDKILVKEPGAFYIEVFYNGVTTKESFIACFDQNKKDKFGQSMYIENVLERSNYIRAKVNPTIVSSDTLKEATTVYIELQKGVSDTALVAADYIAALQPFRNKSMYNIQYISDFGIALPAFQKEIIAICEARGDCGFILTTPLSVQQSSDYMNEILTYKRDTLNSVSSYGGMFCGHVKITEKQTGRDVWISPSAIVTSKIVDQWNNGTPWEPVAGDRKGTLNVLDVYRHFDQDGEESLLLDNGINPIRFDSGGAIKIWGNRTLQIQSSALENLHVRSLLIYIKRPMGDAVRPFLHELNDLDEAEGVRSTIKTILDLFSEDVKSKGGTFAYRNVVDATNNSTQDVIEQRLNVDAYLTPRYGINEIHLNFTVTNSLIEVSEG